MTEVQKQRRSDHVAETSREAYSRSRRSCEQWYDWIVFKLEHAAFYGKTTDELCAMASAEMGRLVPQNEISGRIRELTVAGRIADSQINHRRKTSSGSSAAVHVLPRFAKATVYAPPPKPVEMVKPVEPARPVDAQLSLFDAGRNPTDFKK